MTTRRQPAREHPDHPDDAPQLQAWATWMQAEGMSARTAHSRTSQVKTLARHASMSEARSVAAAEVSVMHVVGWLAGCSALNTHRAYHASASAWCRWLVTQGIRDDDPTAAIKKPRAPHASPRPAPQRVVRAMLEQPLGARSASYVTLAAYAGLRVREIATMRGGQVDCEARTLRVPGKGGRVDTLPAHERIVRLAARMPDRGWWFPGRDHGHVNSRSVSDLIRKQMRAVGYDGTAHQLRHTFGTGVLQSSRDLRVAQELLRHASPATTAIYTAVSDLDRRWAIDRLGEAS